MAGRRSACALILSSMDNTDPGQNWPEFIAKVQARAAKIKGSAKKKTTLNEFAPHIEAAFKTSFPTEARVFQSEESNKLSQRIHRRILKFFSELRGRHWPYSEMQYFFVLAVH